MPRKSANLPFGAICIAVTAFSTVSQTKWLLPVTIEALVDVPARTEGRDGQRRGVLYVAPGKVFTVKKGQRFRMIKIYDEGGCRIAFRNKQYDVSSCPWLDGFTDHQEDVFKVVSGRSVLNLQTHTASNAQPNNALHPTRLRRSHVAPSAGERAR